MTLKSFSKFICSLLVAPLLFAGDLTFADGAVKLSGLNPGSEVVWMALVRERVQNHVEVSLFHGSERATGDGTVEIRHDAAQSTNAIWTIAALDQRRNARGSTPGFPASRVPIPTSIEASSTSFTVRAGALHLLYVRPPGRAWSFTATEGTELDADGTSDALLTIPLSALQPMKGGSGAPAAVQSGDVLLLIDPRTLRSSEVVVP